MKGFNLLRLLLLLSLAVVLRAQSQACEFFDSMLLKNRFESCPVSPFFRLPAGTFYLKLDDATRQLNLDGCTSNDYNSTLSDICRTSLTERVDKSLVSVTCPAYRKIASDGPLGICGEVLHSLGHCVSYVPLNETDAINNSDISMYDTSSLAETVNQIQSTLANYFQVLDRTLVGAYSKDRGQRCLCLDSYKKWLCSSSLNLYKSTNRSNISSCSGGKLASVTNDTLLLIKPCLSVCQRVVQSCPYYLPSSFQADVKNDDTKEVVYGGFPAFDCPRPNTLARLYNNGNCTMCTYAHPNCRHCIGYFNRGAGLSIHNVSTTTFVWTFCIVVMHFLYVM